MRYQAIATIQNPPNAHEVPMKGVRKLVPLLEKKSCKEYFMLHFIGQRGPSVDQKAV